MPSEETLVGVVDVLQDLLILFRGLEGLASRGVVDIVPRQEELGWIRVTLFLENANLVLGTEHET